MEILHLYLWHAKNLNFHLHIKRMFYWIWNIDFSHFEVYFFLVFLFCLIGGHNQSGKLTVKQASSELQSVAWIRLESKVIVQKSYLDLFANTSHVTYGAILWISEKSFIGKKIKTFWLVKELSSYFILPITIIK